MSFRKNTIYNLSALTVLMPMFMAKAFACAPALPFSDTKIIMNKELQQVYTLSGLYFDIPNALKVVYAQSAGIGQNMTAQLVNQQVTPDGKYKCQYQMPLQPLNFEASFDPRVPLPTLPAESINPALPAPVAPASPVIVPPTYAPAAPDPQHQLPYQQHVVPQ